MSYISAWKAPTTTEDLLGSSASPVPLTTTYTVGSTSSEVSVFGAKYLSLYVYLSALGGAGRIDMQIEVAEHPDLGWTPLQTETVSSGTATQNDYEIQKAVLSTGLVLVVSLPVRGLRYWRIKLKSDAGTPEAYVRYNTSGGPL